MGPAQRIRLSTAAHLLVTAAAAASTASFAILVAAFVRVDTSYAIVGRATSLATPWPYRLTGAWSTMGGSLLLWITLQLVLAFFWLRRGTLCALIIAAPAALMAIPMFALANPFARAPVPGFDGVGLTPILRHWAMVIHPPLLTAGLVATSVPWAIAVSALWRQPTTVNRPQPIIDPRRPVLVAWTLLTVGLALGATWAYAEAGWGGYWGWDPVENVGLIPWLALTATLHLPRRAAGSSPRYATAAATTPFVLALTGTGVSRSDLKGSVHAFAAQREVGLAILAIAAAAAMAAIAATATVRRSAAPTTPTATTSTSKGEQRPWRWWSVAPVMVLATAVAIVAAGTFAPAAWQLTSVAEATVTPSFFRRLGAPVLVVGLASMILATDRWRRRIVATTAHTGIFVLSFGIAGSSLGTQATTTLRVGETTTIGDTTVVLRALTTVEQQNGILRTQAVVVRRGPLRSGVVRPAVDAYPDGSVLSEPDIAWGLVDLHGVLRRTATIDGQPVAVVELLVRPFVVTIWVGAALIALAGSLALVQSPSSRSRPPRSRPPRSRPARRARRHEAPGPA